MLCCIFRLFPSTIAAKHAERAATVELYPDRDTFEFVIPPNSNTFSDWRRTCHVSLVKTSWRPRATITWTFDSHVIRSCTFETAANLSASRRQANNFYLCIVLFWVGRYYKTLNDWPLGKQWVLFPRDPQCFPRLRLGEHWGSRGNKTHCFPWGQSLSAYWSGARDQEPRNHSARFFEWKARYITRWDNREILPTEKSSTLKWRFCCRSRPLFV